MITRHLALAAALVSVVGARTASAGEFRIVQDGGYVTVVAEDVPLRDVLWEVGRQAGIEVHGAHGLREAVTIQFRRVLPEEVFRRLLGHRSHVIVVEGTSSAGPLRPTHAYVFASNGSQDSRQGPMVMASGSPTMESVPIPAVHTSDAMNGRTADEPAAPEVATFGPAALTPGTEEQAAPPPADN